MRVFWVVLLDFGEWFGVSKFFVERKLGAKPPPDILIVNIPIGSFRPGVFA